MSFCGDLLLPNKCCFCIPLRLGLLVMGYIKLTISTMFLLPIFIVILLISFMSDFLGVRDAAYISLLTELVTMFTILILDVVFSIAFLIAAHSKNVKILGFYYRYTIVMLVACPILIIIFIVYDAVYSRNDLSDVINYGTWIYMIALGCINTVIEIYFLLALRSEIIKIRSNCKFRFVNDDTDAECVLETDGEIQNKMEERGETEIL